MNERSFNMISVLYFRQCRHRRDRTDEPAARRFSTVALQLTAQGGLPAASIGALAAALGMSKSAVFAHFGSKTGARRRAPRRRRDALRASGHRPGRRGPGRRGAAGRPERGLAGPSRARATRRLGLLTAWCAHRLTAPRHGAGCVAARLAGGPRRASRRRGQRRRTGGRQRPGRTSSPSNATRVLTAAARDADEGESAAGDRARYAIEHVLRRCVGPGPDSPCHPMKIATWNVNGIRARQGQLLEWLAAERPDVVCLQEIKASIDQLPVRASRASSTTGSAGTASKGYSGVGAARRQEPWPLPPAFSHPPFDFESRVISAEVDFGHGPGADLVLLRAQRRQGLPRQAALPRGDGRLGRRGPGRRPAAALLRRPQRRPHRSATSTPRNASRTRSGARADERAIIERLLSRGLVDVGRTLHPDDDAFFTWWAPWRNLKQRNIGWRHRLRHRLRAAGRAPRHLRRAARDRFERPRPARRDVRLTAGGRRPRRR